MASSAFGRRTAHSGCAPPASMRSGAESTPKAAMETACIQKTSTGFE